MPGLANAGTYTVGLGLGYVNGDADYGYETDYPVSISFFLEKNDIFVDRLSLGLQYFTLGDMEGDYGSTVDLSGLGIYGKYTFINRPLGNGSIFAYGKFGIARYSAEAGADGWDGYELLREEDDDSFGISLGIGGGYYFTKALAVTLGYDIHKAKFDSNNFTAHVFSLGVQYRFGFDLGFGKAEGESHTAEWKLSDRKSGNSGDDNWEAGMNMSDYEKSSGNYKSEKPEESQPKAKPVKVKAETQKTVVSATLQDSGSEIVEPTPKITFGSKIKKAWRNMGRKLPAVKEYQRPAGNNSWFGNGWFNSVETGR